MKHRGHPLRGAIAGLFLGLFLSRDLVIFGVLALDADSLALFPVLGLLAGIALGLTAPLKRRSPQPDEPPAGEAPPADLQSADLAPAASVKPESDHSTV